MRILIYEPLLLAGSVGCKTLVYVIHLFGSDLQNKVQLPEQLDATHIIVHSVGAIYMLRSDISYHRKLSLIDPWERIVYCLFCNSMATLKPTKTGRIMLRCNTCGALVFANSLLSQNIIRIM